MGDAILVVWFFSDGTFSARIAELQWVNISSYTDMEKFTAIVPFVLQEE
jgi:hypothetical protein